MDIKIPESLLKAKDISSEYKIFYGMIAYFANANGYCWHGNEKLQEETGNCDRTIRRALAALEDANYITVKRHTSKKDPLYGGKQHKRVIWLREKYLVAVDNLKHAKRKAKIAKKVTLDQFKEQTTEAHYSQTHFKRITGMYDQPINLGVDREGTLYTYDAEYDEKYTLSEFKQNDMWADLYKNYLQELNK